MGIKLLDEPPLLVIRSVAVELGDLNAAVFLQQLHYHCQVDSAELHDGKRWWTASLTDLEREFPFWSGSTIERIVKKLRDEGWIESSRQSEGNRYTTDTPKTLNLTGSTTSNRGEASPQSEGSPSIREEGKEKQEELFGEPATENAEDQMVSEVWDLYFSLFGDRIQVKDLTTQRRTMIRKGLKAVGGNAEVLKRAFLGLKSYRASHDPKKNVSLDVILKTRPGGDNLTDQIEWWAGQAGDVKVDPLAHVPAHEKHIVRERIHSANRYIRNDQRLPEAVREQGKTDAEWLAKNYSLAGTLQDGDTIQWRKIG